MFKGNIAASLRVIKHLGSNMGVFMFLDILRVTVRFTGSLGCFEGQ